MADIVHGRDDLTTHSRSPSKTSARMDSAAAERRHLPPRSDLGTILLHWLTALAFIISLFTGIRMATFGHVLPTASQWLSPIMPQGEMWTWHFFAGLSLFFCASAYLLYVMRGGCGHFVGDAMGSFTIEQTRSKGLRDLVVSESINCEGAPCGCEPGSAFMRFDGTEYVVDPARVKASRETECP